MADSPLPNPGPTPTGFQRTTGGKGFKWQPPTAEHLSKLLPQYEIECILGHGGMGAVYKGKQKSLDRLVAIKILPPELDDEDASYVERFKNEAKVMAKFIHPAIVAVHDFGETTEGQLYIVMEYVDGTDVQKMIQSQGRLPPEHALAITAHVCDALRYAHEHGVIHRDIKPANILINMEGAVKVADFGLAKADEAGASGLTKTGMAMGTPDYVAPEALVMGVNVDGRADLYAIGVMLYNMLTGNVPRGMFKPASVMIPGTDPRYDAIIAKAMQHDRDDRYQSAAEIRRDLDVILTTPLVQAGGQSSAAIPKASIAQKPVAKEPQQKAKPTPAPDHALGSAATPKASPLTWMLPTAVSAIVILGGAYYLGVKKPDVEDDVRSLSSSEGTRAPQRLVTSSPTPAAPIKVREEPKPAPTPVSASPSLPISNSSEPQFPPGKWVKVFTNHDDLPKLGSGVRLEDGWIRTTGNVVTLEAVGLTGSNLGIRATIECQRDSKHFGSLFVRKSDAGRYTAFRSRTASEHMILTTINSTKPASVVTKAQGSWQTPPDGNSYTLELCVVGHRLVSRFGGKLQQCQDATELNSGTVAYSGTENVRDIEVINLDGLPEAEALKILGVDEKGNDLRQPAVVASTPPAPTVSKSPTLPVPTSSAPKFPPGQWVKMFNSPSEAPIESKRPDFGFKFEDGWMTPLEGKKVGFKVPDFPNGSNQAIRLTFQVKKKTEDSGEIRLRHSRNFYVLGLSGQNSFLYFNKGLSEGYKRDEITQGSSNPEWKVGANVKVEFGAVGRRLVARVNDRLLLTALDDHLSSGTPGLMNSMTAVGDIEVINLDGLPEPEALRILGVDEKGNDLRAIIAKQEQQMAEQAKAIDGMAAIPELKTLHEQFTKLTTERVNAPFDADLAKLNSGYIGGIDRKIAEERGKGNLDGVLALEEEKKLIQGVTASSRQPSDYRRLEAVAPCPIPPDDDKTTPTLKSLRQIYREAFAKLEATRAANLKLLTDPLSIRLKQLESTLTQANRIENAKTVREYREAITDPGSQSSPARDQALGGSTPKDGAMRQANVAPATKIELPRLKIDERELAQWVLDHGGTIKLSNGSTLKTGEALPKGSFSIFDVNMTSPGAITEADLLALAALPRLQRFNIFYGGAAITPAVFAMLAKNGTVTTLEVGNSELPDAVFAPLADCRNIESLTVYSNPQFTGQALAYFTRCPLVKIKIERCRVTDDSIRQLLHFIKIEELSLRENVEVTQAGLTHLAGLGKLRKLYIGGTGVDFAHLGVLKACRALDFLSIDNASLSSEAWGAVSQLQNLECIENRSAKSLPNDVLTHLKKLPRLNNLKIANGASLTDADMATIGTFEKLETLWLPSGIGDATMAEVAKLPNLRELSIGGMSTTTTDQGLAKLYAAKKLKSLQFLSETLRFSEAAITAFQKARPDVKVTR